MHTLSKMIIKVEGYPEYTGTDDELQTLVYEVEQLLDASEIYKYLRTKCIKDYPELADKIHIVVTGLN